MGHACGLYTKEGRDVLLVTGGSNADSWLSSTELYDYSLGPLRVWREVGALPSRTKSLRGALVQGVFHVTGGSSSTYLTSILAWDAVSETWTPAGNMTEPRMWHALTHLTSSMLMHL